ncbi:MAG: hypothetical protein AAB263_22470 [Planctomycetota bacterium]
MKKFLVPAIVVVFGICFLLAEMKMFDVGRMLWTVGLLCAGVTLLVYFGVNRTTFIFGSLLIIGSGMSVLRYNGIVSMEKELPIFVIILGMLMAINRTGLIPRDKEAE